jgi:integrase
MASITELKDRQKKPFRAQVKKKGFGVKVAYFSTRDEAIKWCDEIEDLHKSKLTGQKPTKDKLADLTIGKMLTRYIEEVAKHKASIADPSNIRNFLTWKDVANRNPRAFDRYDAKDYLRYLENDYVWQGKTYSLNGKLITPNREAKKLRPAAITRSLAALHHAWKYAANEWREYQQLLEFPNPWSEIKPKTRIKKRRRRLMKGELDKIASACNGCKGHYKLYSLLAINLALETGMRLQEIFNLDWRDILIDLRRIHIRKSKTDYRREVDGRWIVMTATATWQLAHLNISLNRPTEGLLFPMSKVAFKQMWDSILKRAGISFRDRDYKQPITRIHIPKDGVGLTFHDLRREAASRWKRCLLLDEIGAMLGHADKTETEGYLEYDSDDLTEIQNKLDKYTLNDKTFAEVCGGHSVFELAEADMQQRVKAGLPAHIETQHPDMFEYIKKMGWFKETSNETTNVVQLKRGA